MESYEARDRQYGTSVQATEDGTWGDQRNRVSIFRQQFGSDLTILILQGRRLLELPE
jgi:hypothetical protein